MFNKTLVLTAMALATVSLSACKDQSSTKTETKESAVMSDGTRVESTTETDIKVDEDGRRSGTVETKTTVDPEGMMNKETTEESREVVR